MVKARQKKRKNKVSIENLVTDHGSEESLPRP